MSDFWVLVTKELKDLLRDKGLIFGIIIVPLIIYPALGQMLQVGFEQAQEETKVVLVNFDEGRYGNLLIKALESAPNVTVTKIEAKTLDEALKKAQEEEYNMIVIIPKNFSQAIESNQKASVEIYGIVKGISGSMREAISEGRINAVISILNEYLAKLKIERRIEGDPEAILKPIDAKSYTVIKGRIVEIPPSVVSNIKPYKVVKHFSPPLVNVAKEVGVFPSIIASKKNIEEAIKQGNRFLMETDYIDDKRRPGAVLGPKTVPKRTKEFQIQ